MPHSCIFSVNFYNGFKFCPSFLEAVGISVSIPNFRDFPVFAVGFSFEIYPFAGCASAGNTVCKDIDVYRKQLVTISHILK
jgi:hypothetical protein